MSKTLPDRLAFLRDKLQSWPGEMCLTSEDIATLIGLIESSPEAGEQRGGGQTTLSI